YIPSFFEVIYQESGMVKEIIPLKHGYERVKKRWVENLDKAPFICNPIVPYKKIVHDRLNLEIARGCTRGCRFCQAGVIYRPLRERSVEKLEELAEVSLKNSGYEEISLSSLSTGDYSQINQLLSSLMGRYESEKIAVSVPSLRSETLTPELIKEIKKVRKTGFTIAPEAGTQRLRDIINKGINEKEILETVRNVFDAGWNVIKLYFMIGLPCEREEDLEGIVDLSRRVRSIARMGGKRRNVNVSVSTFVPKSHTPFQWEPQIGLEEMKHKQDFLKGEIRRLRLNFKWQDSYMSHLEGIFARGDRKLSSVLVKACQMGCRFDGWSEHLNYNCWDEVLEGVDRDFYNTRKRSKDEVFPWDHIDCGVERDFLWSEYQRGLSAQFTPDCRMEGCQKCGVCNKEKQSISSLRTDEVISDHMGEKKEVATDKGRYVQLPKKGNSVHRVRLQFAKLGRARFLSHLELVTLFSRAIRRAEIPIRFSEGFHPLPKVVFSPALPVGIESIAEYVDLDIDGNTDILELTRKMSHQLPNWFKVLELREIPLKFPSISD
ncbi:MAG: TIGR03960 family B12-binding radical SAM protein, partial [Deltaproteobacteria bacterium]|nr:TIGR03960 family B12-binding radical SAM protein [Deltaproteobacteria bacterium]